ncbi:N-methyl-L-tryptophan oxidase [Entomohabitans teleogrylli]|uniref:N-methyl-L-tryptophan oxidase n=1 Tax=Entomohabitans teleogrylli TaxID=1384589 RepID=UPI00073D83D9|nr:N-methyl-L-tryptophan oxidase [Entomohabitans teleogrylli]
MQYDFIVVGSGSVGAAAGYYATRAGLKVLMIDSAHPPHQQGSHHGDTRLIRYAYGEGEKYVPLLLRARQLWEALQQESGERLLDRSGVINIGPQDSTFLRNVAASAAAWQLPLETLTAAETMSRWPQLRVPENYIGLFEPDAGVLHSETAIAAWIRLARENGCAQLFNCPVTGITRSAQGVEVTTPEGCYQAQRLLISAGTWVTRLLPDLPVAPVRKVFAWHQADGRYSSNNHFPGFTVELANGDQFYGFPADNNALKVGKHNGGQPISAPQQRVPFGACASDGSESFSFLRQFLPGVGVCLHGAACTYDNSPDEDFIIDTLTDLPEALVISGLSGHGFKFASVLGEIACAFACGEENGFDLGPFSLSRFRP